MRWMLRTIFLPVVMTIVPLTTWAQGNHERGISGKLMFAQAVACEDVKVELEVVEMEAIETAYADPSCNFKFTRSGPGTYLIHVDVAGYEEVHQRVDNGDVSGFNVIQMVAAPGRVVRNGHPAPSLDVSEMLDQYPRKAVDLYNKALNSHKKGKDEQAIDQLQQALKIAPDFYAAHNLLGMLYHKAGQLDAAEEQFVQARQINSHNPEPLINLSSLYLQEDKPERAAEVSQQAVLENSKSVPALFNLGIALYKLSKLDKAEEILKRALEVAPKMPQIHLALANVYLKLRRYDNLLDQLNTYLEQNPNSPQREQVERLRSQVMKAKSDGTF